MKSILHPLLFWIALAYGLCLAPSGFFNRISSMGFLARWPGDWMDWAAHTALMAMVACPISRACGDTFKRGSLSSKNDHGLEESLATSNCHSSTKLAWALSMGLVFLIALPIEGLQALLPESFSRGFSWSDIWASLVGGLIGAVGARRIGKRTTEYTE